MWHIGCLFGSHRVSRRSVLRAGEVKRGLCRNCGCGLVQDAVTRRWEVEGVKAG